MELITEVKKGFKQMEVGWIPEDWKVANLNENTSKIGSGITPTGGKKVYKDFGRPFIRSQNIGWGNLKLDDLAYIDEPTHSTFSTTEIKENDVLLNITGASIGRSALANSQISGGNVNQHVCIIRANERNVYPNFLKFVLLSEIGQSQIDSFQAGGNREGLNFGQIGSFKVPLPPTLEEQQAIAEALSDVDDLIRSLDTLIEKKSAIKKGTMQQFLTGKKRLQGFDGEWKVKKLGDCGKTYNGLTGKKKSDFGSGHHSYITFLNVVNNTVIDPSAFENVEVGPGESQNEVKKGDLLFNTSSETPDEVGLCAVLLKNVKSLYLNSFCFGFRLTDEENVHSLFLAYFFRSQYGRKLMQVLAQGSTRYNLSKSKFLKVTVKMPELKEQIAIVSVLEAMDQELQSLQQKRDKYKRIKQGMMQELLTGKTRLL